MIAAVSGLVLLIVMFVFDWFGAPGSDIADAAAQQAEELGLSVPDVDLGFNVWDSLEFIRWILLITGLVAVGLGIASAMSRDVALPVAGSALIAGLGILSVLLVLYRIIDPPSGADREIGVFLGLIATAGVAYGGWVSMQEEGTSFGDQAGQFQGGGTADPPPPPPPAQGPAA
jgi:hypothetical protein